MDLEGFIRVLERNNEGIVDENASVVVREFLDEFPNPERFSLPLAYLKRLHKVGSVVSGTDGSFSLDNFLSLYGYGLKGMREARQSGDGKMLAHFGSYSSELALKISKLYSGQERTSWMERAYCDWVDNSELFDEGPHYKGNRNFLAGTVARDIAERVPKGEKIGWLRKADYSAKLARQQFREAESDFEYSKALALETDIKAGMVVLGEIEDMVKFGRRVYENLGEGIDYIEGRDRTTSFFLRNRRADFLLASLSLFDGSAEKVTLLKSALLDYSACCEDRRMDWSAVMGANNKAGRIAYCISELATSREERVEMLEEAIKNHGWAACMAYEHEDRESTAWSYFGAAKAYYRLHGLTREERLREEAKNHVKEAIHYFGEREGNEGVVRYGLALLEAINGGRVMRKETLRGINGRYGCFKRDMVLVS
tara:strand:- start:2098 stop:3375 length:1278 start_codon:yes stop_codon:yes gene_type:complete